MTASGRSPTAVRDAISTSPPTTLRSAQTAVRRFARAAGPAAPGHRVAATVSRSWAPGTQGKESEQTATGRRERELLAFAFRGHPSQQPHPQHRHYICKRPRMRLSPC